MKHVPKASDITAANFNFNESLWVTKMYETYYLHLCITFDCRALKKFLFETEVWGWLYSA